MFIPACVECSETIELLLNSGGNIIFYIVYS